MFLNYPPICDFATSPTGERGSGSGRVTSPIPVVTCSRNASRPYPGPAPPRPQAVFAPLLFRGFALRSFLTVILREEKCFED